MDQQDTLREPSSGLFRSVCNSWLYGLKYLSDNEVRAMMICSRWATIALSVEKMDRISNEGHPDLDTCCGLLSEHAHRIKGADLALAQAQEAQLQDLNRLLRCPNSRRGEALVQSYLCFVSMVLGWPYALLIFCALGKSRLLRASHYTLVGIVQHACKISVYLVHGLFGKEVIQYAFDQVQMAEPTTKSILPNVAAIETNLGESCSKRPLEDSNDESAAGIPLQRLQRSNDLSPFDTQRSSPQHSSVIPLASNFKIQSEGDDQGKQYFSEVPLSIPALTGPLNDASKLLMLVHFMDKECIPERIFLKAGNPQKIWGASGEIQEITIHRSGLQEGLISLLSDSHRVQTAMDNLASGGYITFKENRASLGRTLHPQLDRRSPPIYDPLHWKVQALLLVCHTFPLHEYVGSL